MERNIILVSLLILCCCSIFGQEIGIKEYEALSIKNSNETGTVYSQIIDVKSKGIVLDSIDRIEPDKGLYKVYKSGKVGFYGLGGGIQIEPKYDTVEYIRNGRHGYLILTNNNMKGLYSLFDTPKMALDIQYDEITSFKYEYSDYVIMEKNGKKGVYSIKKNQLYVDTLFDDVEFSGSYILLRNNNKQGALNKEGEIVFDTKYDKVYWNRVLLIAESGTKKEFYSNEKHINKELDVSKRIRYNEGDYMTDIVHCFIYKQDGKYGIVDDNDQIIVKPIYSSIEEVKWGGKKKEARLIVERDNKKGVIDLKEEVIVPLVYDSIKPFVDEVYQVSHENKNYLYDIERREIIKSIPFDVINLDNNSTKEEIYYHIEYNGKENYIKAKEYSLLFPWEYSKIYNNKESYKAKKENKYGVVNKNNTILIPFEYDNMELTCNTLYYIVHKQNLKGLINLKGEFVWPLEARLIYAAGNGFYLNAFSSDEQEFDCNLDLVKK